MRYKSLVRVLFLFCSDKIMHGRARIMPRPETPYALHGSDDMTGEARASAETRRVSLASRAPPASRVQ